MNTKKSKTFYLLVVLIVTIILFPFYWQFITSLKSSAEIFVKPPLLVPRHIFLKNYELVFTSGPPFATYIKNSTIVASGTTVICLFFGAMSAYALARTKMKGKNIILAGVLSVSMFPVIAIVSPLFLVLRELKLLNTYLGLIIPYCTFGLPLAIWTLSTFFRELPIELEESAKIDGCNTLQAMCKIIIPLAAPGVFVTAILVFIFAWNEFLLALVFNTRYDMRTVTVGITMFPGLYEMPWGTIFAASTIVTFPLIIAVLILQRRIIAGLTAGAIKG